MFKYKKILAKDRKRIAFLLMQYADMLSGNIERGAWKDDKKEFKYFNKQVSDCYKLYREILKPL